MVMYELSVTHSMWFMMVEKYTCTCVRVLWSACARPMYGLSSERLLRGTVTHLCMYLRLDCKGTRSVNTKRRAVHACRPLVYQKNFLTS